MNESSAPASSRAVLELRTLTPSSLEAQLEGLARRLDGAAVQVGELRRAWQGLARQIERAA
ncbi:hypothetical protein HNR42_001021 [Deinobacterium chartae]|uniref:Uncharacterized protein n=1 Tax=Deinobacterium chartae TaxID=521158 RepID=A0A841HY75_9DEIO|nr:hypothetical protein [Deinobacterium chartae]MBB6097604.1 hypothetical protein [Deinobacterium chartae]